MPGPLPHPALDQRGFILVGVVTFMLALTILGLSLFALSSYEAQFFYASASREQSLQNAESGMELVKALLAQPTARLEVAHQAERQIGVTSALAYQQRSGSPTDTTSSGPVDWGSPIVIAVSARSGGVERTLEQEFTSQTSENPYKFLVACGGSLTYDQSNSTDPSLMVMAGRAWQPVRAAADTVWTREVAWISGRPVRADTPPLPRGDAFVTAHLSALEPSGSSGSFKLDDGTQYQIKFVNTDPSAPAFFRMDPNDPAARPSADHPENDPEYTQYDFYVNDHPITLRVRGTVVWVIAAGALFKNVVNVLSDNSTPSTLVIVAGANGRDPRDTSRALWFQGGLQITDSNMRVFLVSEHDIAMMLMNQQAKLADHEVPNVSIVAGGDVVLQGPAPLHQFTLRYAASPMDALADDLLAKHALPALAGGGGAVFVPVAQTWLETTPR